MSLPPSRLGIVTNDKNHWSQRVGVVRLSLYNNKLLCFASSLSLSSLSLSHRSKPKIWKMSMCCALAIRNNGQHHGLEAKILRRKCILSEPPVMKNLPRSMELLLLCEDISAAFHNTTSGAEDLRIYCIRSSATVCLQDVLDRTPCRFR